MKTITELLKDEAQEALRQAEKAYYIYASKLEVGREREAAFEIYENIRNAGRVY